EAAVRVAQLALRARGVDAAGIHTGRVLIGPDGGVVSDDRLVSLVATAQQLARATEGRAAASTLVARLVRNAFAVEELPRDGSRPTPAEGAWMVGAARPGG